MTIKEAYKFLEEAAGYGSKLGLESMTKLLDGLGNPQDKLKFVHIAGTNGKGSTAAFISSILVEAGLCVGRYISPSVFSYEEKIQITYRKDSVTTEYIKDTEVAYYIEKIKQVCMDMVKKGMAHPTVFEIETAMAMLHFYKSKCNVVVLEVGLGGKLDATNVIQTTECAVITSISMDHMEYLGDTLSQIAEQKAGIIKPGVFVASYDLKEEAMKVIEKTCEKQGAKLSCANFSNIKNLTISLEKTVFDYEELTGLEIHLLGINQVYNAIVAIHTAKALVEKGYNISLEEIKRGLKNTRWSGRFEVINKQPLFIIDGAHNEDAAFLLAQNIKLYLANKKIFFIMGVLKDKEYEKILDVMKGLGEEIFTVTPQNSRALTSSSLAKVATEKGFLVEDAGTTKNAVELTLKKAKKEDVILSFGSLSYLQEVISALNAL